MRHNQKRWLLLGVGGGLICGVIIMVTALIILGSSLIAQSGSSGATPQSTRELVKFVFETPVSPTPELLPLQGVASPTVFLLPEATSTLEPSATATRVVENIATFTSTPPLPPTPTSTATSLPPPAPEPTSTPTPAPIEFKHVVIISIDGLRPDAWDVADTPNLDNLKLKGAYSPNAKSVWPSETMPNHASMLGGMSPDKHGIVWNILYAEAPRIKGPTLFSVAHDAGRSTAMVVGKVKLEYLVIPGSVDQFKGGDISDAEVKDQAIAIIQAGLPNVLFIHFPDVDRQGHAVGWMSPAQLQAVTVADGLIGEIVAALRNGTYLDSTLLIVTADHGGSGTTHDTDTPENTTIPWLAVGPGVPVGVTLSSPITTYDTAATALRALNLPIPAEWDGHAILEIFN